MNCSCQPDNIRYQSIYYRPISLALRIANLKFPKVLKIFKNLKEIVSDGLAPS